MNTELDPVLQNLFSEARREVPNGAFTARVMARVDRQKRRRALAWIGFDLVLLVGAWILAEPLQAGLFMVMPFLTTTLIPVQDGLLAELLLPINNVASLLAFGFFALRSFYKRFRSWRR